MDKLYLITYKSIKYMTGDTGRICIDNGIKSISLTEISNIPTVKAMINNICHIIEKQTGDKEIEILSITSLHKLIEDGPDRENKKSSSPIREVEY